MFVVVADWHGRRDGDGDAVLFPGETHVVIMKFEQGVASRPRALPLHLALSASKY